MPLAYQLMIGATVASGAAAGVSARNAGKAQKIELEQAAIQEQDAARESELERRTRLVRALSSQVTTRAAQGLDMSGSARAIALSDASEADLGLLTDRVNSQRRATSLRNQGRQAAAQGRIGMFTSILDAGISAGQTYAGGVKATNPGTSVSSGPSTRGGRRRPKG
jgi:hypothetical protein